MFFYWQLILTYICSNYLYFLCLMHDRLENHLLCFCAHYVQHYRNRSWMFFSVPSFYQNSNSPHLGFIVVSYRHWAVTGFPASAYLSDPFPPLATSWHAAAAVGTDGKIILGFFHHYARKHIASLCIRHESRLWIYVTFIRNVVFNWTFTVSFVMKTTYLNKRPI